MKGAVLYHGVLLAPSSEAFALHAAGDFKKLAAHMKQLHQAMVARGERKE